MTVPYPGCSLRECAEIPDRSRQDLLRHCRYIRYNGITAKKFPGDGQTKIVFVTTFYGSTSSRILAVRNSMKRANRG